MLYFVVYVAGAANRRCGLRAVLVGDRDGEHDEPADEEQDARRRDDAGGPTTLGTLLVQESAESTATDGTPTATDRPEQGGQFDGLGGVAVSALFLVGGAVVVLLLVRN